MLSKVFDGREPNRVPVAAMRALHQRFVTGEVNPAELDGAAIRPVVADSWRRSLAKGVDPDFPGSATPHLMQLEQARLAHPLAAGLPVIRRLLVNDAIDSGVVVAVTDASGRLLWVEGDTKACRRAESINFVPGADWSENGAGTNAPGTAVALDREVQIRSSEHFSRPVQLWNCAAVPVHDPHTGVLLGAIDLTGGSAVALPQTLALVRATAVAVENHLALQRAIEPDVEAGKRFSAKLTVLGPSRPKWQFVDEFGSMQTLTLSPRHADILALLTRHPEGLSSDHLAMLLDDKDLDVVTVRAEMSRLRRVIHPRFVGSRPYRLLEPVASDLNQVFGALAAGNAQEALNAYTGALLAQSMAPAICRLRIELSAGVRAAVTAARDTGMLMRWLQLPEGCDDHEGWRLLYQRAESGSAIRAHARGHLIGLDFELG
ncbi:MAG: GAF domain-containing protein [Actinobacteria bacterium]|nr:GAF domain-containing protein [Actinomycetota bacterium]